MSSVQHKRGKRRLYNNPNWFTKAGEVKVINALGEETVEPAYSPGEYQRIVKMRASVSAGTRVALYRRDGGKCRYCGRPCAQSEWEPDHVVPVALGGSNRMGNLVVACMPCNRRKGAKVWTPKPLEGKRRQCL